MTIRERLSNSQIVLLRSLAKRGGGRSVTIEQWQRKPAIPLWRRGLIEIWYRQSPGELAARPVLLPEHRRSSTRIEFYRGASRDLWGRERLMINHPHRSKAAAKANGDERAVLVTTTHRGVFFGYAVAIDGEMIDLRAGRNCLYWSVDVKGFAGLAATGPSKNCRVGPAVDIQLRDITSVSLVTPEAVKAWEAAPWK